jgi:hypothetical protein
MQFFGWTGDKPLKIFAGMSNEKGTDAKAFAAKNRINPILASERFHLCSRSHPFADPFALVGHFWRQNFSTR